jgi:hypothetical protein
MIPIELEWTVPKHGATAAFDDDFGWEVIRYWTDEERPVHYKVTHLLEPYSIRLLNSASASAIASFVGRFGLLSKELERDRNSLVNIESAREDIHDLFTFYSPDDPKKVLQWTNDRLKQAELELAFELVDGKRRLVYRAKDLKSLLFYECAIALDVGAVLARCAHCGSAFLTGPLTGRRSHAIYCAEKCRVAAFRLKSPKTTSKLGAE